MSPTTSQKRLRFGGWVPNTNTKFLVPDADEIITYAISICSETNGNVKLEIDNKNKTAQIYLDLIFYNLSIDQIVNLKHTDITLTVVHPVVHPVVPPEYSEIIPSLLIDEIRFNSGIIDSYNDKIISPEIISPSVVLGGVKIVPVTEKKPSLLNYFIAEEEFIKNPQYYIKHYNVNESYAKKKKAGKNKITYSINSYLDNISDINNSYDAGPVIYDGKECVTTITFNNVTQKVERIYWTHAIEMCLRRCTELMNVIKKHINLVYPLVAIEGHNIPNLSEYFLYKKDFDCNIKKDFDCNKNKDFDCNKNKICHFRQFGRGTCWAAAVLNAMFIIFNKHINCENNKNDNKNDNKKYCYAYEKYKQYEAFLDVNRYATDVIEKKNQNFFTRITGTKIKKTIEGHFPPMALNIFSENSDLKLSGFTIQKTSLKDYIYDVSKYTKVPTCSGRIVCIATYGNNRTIEKFNMKDFQPNSVYVMLLMISINASHAYALHYVSEKEYYIYDSNEMFAFNSMQSYNKYIKKIYDISGETITKLVHSILIKFEPPQTPPQNSLLRWFSGGGSKHEKVYKSDLYRCNDNRKRKVFRIKGDKNVHANTLFTTYKGKIVRVRDIPHPTK